MMLAERVCCLNNSNNMEEIHAPRKLLHKRNNTKHTGVETAGSQTSINLGRWRASGAIGDINNNCPLRRTLLAGDAMSSVTSGNAGAGRSGNGAGAGDVFRGS
jgi:hypothetical protein